MRTLALVLLFSLAAAPASAQEVQTCWESVLVACEATEASPVCYTTKLVPCTEPAPTVQPARIAASHPSTTVLEHPRRRVLFWTGLGLVAAGTTLSVLAVTALQRSDEHAPANALPCGTDPVLATRYTIAHCQPNYPLMVTGLSLAGAGGTMVFLANRPVAIVVSPQLTGLRVRF